MKKSTKISLLVVGIAVVLIGVIGITYAFFSTGGKQETANTFTSGCLNISLTDASSSINLNNIYPITDIEGLDTTSYDFTITNTCSTEANYEINLESLNQTSNSLSADYIKVSLSSDTVGNVISILSDNTSVTPEVANAYEAYNLYTGTLEASETKTYHLKLWLDYDATVEEAANKVYQSKINVVANPEIQVVDNLEAIFELNDKTLTTNLTNNVTSATYCTTTDNICTPNTSATITNNTYTVELQGNENKQMVCTRLNGTSKIICSNPLEIAPTYLAEVIKGYNQSTRTFPLTTSSKVEDSTTGVIYKSANSNQYDNDGEVYYFAGNPTDNWVKWAGFYWRIIRINGNGSIRMIYQGTNANTTDTGTQLQTSTFNDSYNRSEYVGLKYTTGSQHGTGSNSTIMGVLNTWYNSKLASYVDDIDTNVGFCSDRNMASGYSWSSQPSSAIYYAAYDRLVKTSSNVNPSFKCSNSSDLLKLPVGLITADEVIMAGLPWSGSTTSNYLYTGEYYWTMSPYAVDSSGWARVFLVYSTGRLNGTNVTTTLGVRPVVNLKASVQISSGNGTSSNPYVILSDRL